MEIYKLKYNEAREGWECTCGAFYKRDKNWKPNISWCARCKNYWQDFEL